MDTCFYEIRYALFQNFHAVWKRLRAEMKDHPPDIPICDRNILVANHHYREHLNKTIKKLEFLQLIRIKTFVSSMNVPGSPCQEC